MGRFAPNVDDFPLRISPRKVQLSTDVSSLWCTGLQNGAIDIVDFRGRLFTVAVFLFKLIRDMGVIQL